MNNSDIFENNVNDFRAYPNDVELNNNLNPYSSDVKPDNDFRGYPNEKELEKSVVNVKQDERERKMYVTVDGRVQEVDERTPHRDIEEIEVRDINNIPNRPNNIDNKEYLSDLNDLLESYRNYRSLLEKFGKTDIKEVLDEAKEYGVLDNNNTFNQGQGPEIDNSDVKSL